MKTSTVSQTRRWSGTATIFALAVSLFVAAGISSSCSHTQVWVATGESIDALGQSFLATGRALDAAYDVHQISEAQYEKWRVFVKYFKPVYDLAAERWKKAENATAAEHAGAVLAALSKELATFIIPGADAGRGGP